MSIKTVCKLFRSTSPRSIKRISASWFVTERLAIPKTSVSANQRVFYIAQKNFRTQFSRTELFGGVRRAQHWPHKFFQNKNQQNAFRFQKLGVRLSAPGD